MNKPVVLLILDGYGLSGRKEGNAVSMARTPNMDTLFATCPHCRLSASGEDVGLPQGQIGNSEVGHTNIGAGRVVWQDLPRISNAIKDGSFFQNEVYLACMKQAAETNHALHILGLLSDGGVHSHISHLKALMKMARDNGVPKTYVHAFLDGRDVGPKTGIGYMRELLEETDRLHYGAVATVQGRFYGMDRDNRAERLRKGWGAIVRGEGVANTDPLDAIEASYKNGVTDEFMEPTVCAAEGCIREGDSVIFLNFRPDRAREMTAALTQPTFSLFDREGFFFPLHYVCTAQYDASFALPIAFPPENPTDTFGDIVSRASLRQLRIAETEKYAHVTFFFNGGEEQPKPGEDRILVPSPREVPTYDLIPEMSAYAVTEKAVDAILNAKQDVFIINLANCDMVGHTGVLAAAIQAVETVDACVGAIAQAVSERGGILAVTADHGNADCMLDENGSPHTAHTTNPVPFILSGTPAVSLRDGRLCDIAPTLLDLMSIPGPEAMTGRSLINHAGRLNQ